MPSNEPSKGRASGLRVLVVEDEFMVALLLQDMLTDLGHTVVGPVARLAQAVEMARREALDVAILDVNLDGLETYPVAEALAARHISFFFATGYDQKSLREPYSSQPILKKPFGERDLRNVLSKVPTAKRGRS